MRIVWTVVQTALGPMLVAATDKGVCRLAFGVGREDLAEKFPHATLVEGGAQMADLFASVVAAVEGKGESQAIPLDVRGTAFQQRVWQALREIPVGATASYTDIAQRIGAPNTARAVAGACAATVSYTHLLELLKNTFQ